MTEAVIDALQSELQRTPVKKPLAVRVKAIVDDLAALGKPGGRDLTKDEIDDLWGQP